MKVSTGTRNDSGDPLLRKMAARKRRDNVVFGALAVLAVIGGGATVLGWLLPSKHAAVADSTASIGQAQLAGAFAAEFVGVYLGTVEGQADRLERYVSGAATLKLPTTRRPAADPAAVQVRLTKNARGLQVWSALVSVRIDEHGTRRYYGVPVVVSQGAPRALNAPMLVAAPELGPELVQAYSATCAASTPLAAAAAGFLTAYLTGSGELSRYAAVGSGIKPVHPAPYGALDNISVSADDRQCGSGHSGAARVLVKLTPKDRDGTAGTLAYPLVMVRVDGQQWQVRELEVVPALADPVVVVGGQPTPQPSSAATSTTAVTIPPAHQN
ncbi:MAG: conjugal transfer protein [Mycobacteriaceae bacterium]|nr:conjugal transfer protein [Mycobacteriaceae bacterium]